MFSLLKKVIDKIGPRPPCSEAEKKLGRLLVEEWKPLCDSVDVELFTCSPTAYISSFYLIVLLYFATVVLYWFLPPLALAFAVVSCSIVVLEVFRSLEFVDFLFPRRHGENVTGTIRPKGKPVQRVIISAHMDSAYEFNLYYYLKSASFLVIAVSILAIVIALCGSLAKTIAYFNVFSNEAALIGVGIALIALSPIAGLFLLWTSWKPVPGAMDNMSGVAIVAGLGNYLDDAKRSGDWFPERTEVVLLGVSSEEAGTRGAKRYVRSHIEELKTTPTYVLDLNSICDETLLTVLKREVFNGARYDTKLVRIAQEVAASHNWPISALSHMMPGGGSDAARFALCGIPATWLACADFSRLAPNYHTRNDTPDHVRPESLSVMLQLVIEIIQRIDER